MQESKGQKQAVIQASGMGLLGQILELIPYAVFWKDRHSNYLGCNPTFAQQCGLADAAEIVGLSDFDMPWSKAEAEAYRLDDAQVMDSGESKLHIVETQCDQNGGVYWLDTCKVPLVNAKEEVVGVLGVYADITEQREGSIELARTRSYLEAAIDGIDSGIVLYDEEEQLVFCNDKYRQIYPMPADQMRPGMTYEQVLSGFYRHHWPNDPDGLDEWVGVRLEQHRRCEPEWVQQIGERQIRVSDQRTSDGGIVSLRTDVTAMKGIEAELRQAKEEADKANAAKSQFLANMSHEIRTPMTAILGFTEMLLGMDVQGDARRAVETIQGNGKHLLGLINDILDLSKVEADRVEPDYEEVVLASMLDDVVDLMIVRASSAEVELSIDYAGPVPDRVWTDSPRVKQILVNLVGNAIKFTEKGSVTLRPSWVVTDGKGMLCIDVVDTGIGLTEEQISRIFQPFEQADCTTTRKYGGTGLGLTISTRFAHLLGGRLSVQSEVGSGSTFRLELPECMAVGSELWTPDQAPYACKRVIAPKPVVQTDALAGRHVLLAEDGLDNQHLISYVLRGVGATVTLAANGEEAIAVVEDCRRNGQQLDLVLMDMQMPVLDGYEATGRLIAEGCTLPIVALTANAMEGDRERCLGAGCCDYVSKPVPFAQLIEVCMRWMPQAA